MTKSFHISVIGARHTQEGKPCQDFSTDARLNDVAIAVVCDGHGGKPYFRSDIGAKFAAEAAVECITQFIDETHRSALAGKPYAAFNLSEKPETDDETLQIFRPLFASLVQTWMQKVFMHLLENPFTDEEMQCVPEAYRPYCDDIVVSAAAYGTTLVAYAQCDDFWLAFQIGDGAMLIFRGGDCFVPIPDDANCHDNITTSLCDLNALDEFRFCVDGSGNFPTTAFVCTDGLQKCFESEEGMGEYLLKMSRLVAAGVETLFTPLMERTLPKLSLISGGDDISIAGVSNSDAPE